jgi:hypothetical protein
MQSAARAGPPLPVQCGRGRRGCGPRRPPAHPPARPPARTAPVRDHRREPQQCYGRHLAQETARLDGALHRGPRRAGAAALAAALPLPHLRFDDPLGERPPHAARDGERAQAGQRDAQKHEQCAVLGAKQQAAREAERLRGEEGHHLGQRHGGDEQHRAPGAQRLDLLLRRGGVNGVWRDVLPSTLAPLRGAQPRAQRRVCC